MMIRIAAIALALCGVQEGKAKRLLEKVEARFTASKGLEIKFRFRIEEQREQTFERREGPGTAMIKGEKVFVSMLVPRGGKDVPFELVSDGRRTAWHTGAASNPPVETPAHFSANLRVFWARVGVGGPPIADMRPWWLLAQTGKPDAADHCEVKDVEEKTDEKGASYLAYFVDHPGLPSGKARYELWYDPKSFLPAKLLIRYKGDGVQGTYQETYEKIDPEAELPDERFSIPRGK